MNRRLGFGGSIVIATLALSWGCEVTRPLGWRYQDDGGLGPTETRTATIWEGPCDTGDIFWSAVLPPNARPDTYDIPTIPFDGQYCFEILVVDRANDCAVVRASQQREELGTQDSLTVSVALGPPAAGVRCVPEDVDGEPLPPEEALCDPERGCLRCPDGWERCEGLDVPGDVRDRFCCDFDFRCPIAGLPGSEGDCIEIAPAR